MRQTCYICTQALHWKTKEGLVRMCACRGTAEAGINYAISLNDLRRFEETRSLLRKTTPVAQRVLGKCNDITLRMRWIYTATLCEDGATLDELHEAVATFEEIGG